ncbi:hypothetical protein K1719_002347 [Acacia pycnantha]|nr:hypothetical protein K1719_002347 [Acacia pycnantha]
MTWTLSIHFSSNPSAISAGLPTSIPKGSGIFVGVVPRVSYPRPKYCGDISSYKPLFSINTVEFFPLLLKLVAWHGESLVVALEKVEKSSGPLLGNGIASIQQNAAPKMLLALMDEAYTGSTIEDGAGDSESEDSSAIDVDNPLFLELLKDENDGLVVTTCSQKNSSSNVSNHLRQRRITMQIRLHK